MRAVIRIGGSVIASPPNPELMRGYGELLRKLRGQGHELAVVVGGGSLARESIEWAKKMGLKEPDQDRVAVMASRLVAQPLASFLGLDEVPSSLRRAVTLMERHGIVVMGGLKPGMTTDSVAALLAERLKADILVKATDQDGVYTKDPRKYPDALKLEEMTIQQLEETMAETRHRAGIHQIVDPEAVKLLKRCRIKTVIVNGFNPENVGLAIEGGRVGTLIHHGS
ncbi:MAG: UMP kinase [Candidatus Bathyarchaeia archaeon]